MSIKVVCQNEACNCEVKVKPAVITFYSSPDKRSVWMNLCLISLRKSIMYILIRVPVELLVMSSRNICICGDIRKVSYLVHGCLNHMSGPSCSKLTMSLVNVLLKL